VIRTFIAIAPSDPVLDDIERFQAELRQTQGDVRWVARAAMHLTIQFLGEVPEPEMAGIERALRETFAAQPPVEIESRGVGVFPNLKKPRVIWAGLHGAGLAELAERSEIALAPLGFPPEDRELTAHITLGRLRSMRGWEGLAAALRAASSRSFGTSRIDHAVLFRSDLKPSGSVYTPLAELPFGGAA
jgi:2'-5' RNA ligase